jgi:quinoprotein glucose dehydrogenase
MVDLTAPEEGTSSPGRDLYGIQCGVCHGAGTQQTGQLARSPSIEEIRNRISTQQLLRPNVRRVIELGKGFMPSFEHLTDTEKDAIIGFLFDENDHSLNTPAETGGLPKILYSHTGYNRFLDQDGYPAVKPPWGTLNAIDLSEGQIKWQVPLGEFPELSSRGIPQTGTENYGGPVVTAGGLIFIGATQDEKFRAIDKVTGDTLWKASLPAGGYATPATYAVEGKQYVVIAAGGGKMGTKSGDAFVAFTLPD